MISRFFPDFVVFFPQKLSALYRAGVYVYVRLTVLLLNAGPIVDAICLDFSFASFSRFHGRANALVDKQ